MPQKILVVDDEPSICDNLVTYLTDEGWQVYTAHSGEEAMRSIENGLEVQACIMDLRLPKMSGISTIVAIRDLIPGMQFVIHTGSENDAVTTALHQAGLDQLPILRKPLLDMGQLAQFL